MSSCSKAPETSAWFLTHSHVAVLSKPASTEEILALVQLLGGYFENEKLKLQNNTMSQAMITEMTRLSM